MMTFKDLMKSYNIDRHRSNTSVYEELLEQIENNQVIPIIGAGLSCWAGYPLWRNLLLKLSAGYKVKDNVAEYLDQDKYEEAASELAKPISEGGMGEDNLREALREEYKSDIIKEKKRPGYQKWLRKLFKGVVVTTNYDVSLEELYLREPLVVTPENPYYTDEMDYRLSRNKPMLVKLHGTIDDPSHIVLTKERYDKTYGSNPEQPDITYPLPNTLQKIFRKKIPLFLGCGLGPDRTCSVLKHSIDTMGFALLELPKETENKANPYDPHLMNDGVYIPALQKRLEFINKLQLKVIWYPYGKHDSVGTLINRLAEDRKLKLSKLKKTMIWCAAAVIAAAIAVFGFLTYLKNKPESIREDQYHITLKATNHFGLKDYDTAKEVLERRINILTEGKDQKLIYDDGPSHSIDIYLSKASIKNEPIQNVIKKYISCAAKLYLIDKQNREHWIPVLRKDIEIAKANTGIIPNVNAREYGVTDIPYPYIVIALSDEFISQHKDEYETWEELAFAQDIEEEYLSDDWYVYNTFSIGDGKNFCVLNSDTDKKYTDLMEEMLNKPNYPENFSYEVDANYLVHWEDPQKISLPKGKYQRAYDDFVETTISFALKKYYGELTEGVFTDIRKALLIRLDALGEPYALGESEDNEIIVIKTTPDHINTDVLRLIGSSDSLYIVSRNSDDYAEDVFHKDNNEKLYLDTNEFSSYKKANWDLMKAIAGNELMYIRYGFYPLLQFDPNNISKQGIVSMDYCCVKDGKLSKLDINGNNLWLGRFINSLIETHSIMHNFEYNYAYMQKYNPDKNGDIADAGEMSSLLFSGEEAINSFVHKVYPDAYVHYYLSSADVSTDIPINDSFPQETAKFAKKIKQMLEEEGYYIRDYNAFVQTASGLEQGKVYAMVCYDMPKLNPNSDYKSADEYEKLDTGLTFQHVSIYELDKKEEYEKIISDILQSDQLQTEEHMKINDSAGMFIADMNPK